MARLELHGIAKSFGPVEALRDVSFTCQDGEFFCLLGASGAGKSTTVNVVSGIEKPDGGTVLLEGNDITSAFPQDRNVATAFESYAIYPHFTVYQNLMFPLEAPRRKAEYTPAAREARVREIAEMLGMGALLQRYPRELSGGERQRVALGRTLVRRPQAYLLDEPIAHLDAKLRHRMRSELKKIQQEMGITTLYCTPDQLEALSMADTIAVLNKGRIEQMGTADDIYYRPRNLYVATFVGVPPMNVLAVECWEDHATVQGKTPFEIRLRPEDRASLQQSKGFPRCLIGVRPKDIRLVPHEDPSTDVPGKVTLIDTLGQTSIITLHVDDAEIRVRASSDRLPSTGDTVGLAFDSGQLHFFEPETGLSFHHAGVDGGLPRTDLESEVGET